MPSLAAGDQEWSLDINLASIHQQSHYRYQGAMHDYNESNPGIGFTYGYSDNIELKFGFFENSYEKHSNYATVSWHKNYQLGDIRIAPGIGAVLVTGYDDTPEDSHKLQPGILPCLTIGYQRVNLAIGLVPSVKSQNVATFQLQFLL